MALKAYKYKYGDIVKVVRKAYDQFDWAEEMDEYVGDGNLYTVISRFGNSKKIRLNTTPHEYMFDTKALELITEAEPLPVFAAATPTPIRLDFASGGLVSRNSSGHQIRWNGSEWS